MVSRLADLEATAPSASVAVQGRESALVSQNEFRLFKWLAAFVIAVLLAGFGVLFQQMTDLRLSVERGRAEVIREFGVIGGRLGRIETKLAGMDDRLSRVETRDGVETKTTRVRAQGDRVGRANLSQSGNPSSKSGLARPLDIRGE